MESGDSDGVQLFIRVRVGGDGVALVTESTDGSEGRARTVEAAERLLERKDVKCAVAVCYSSNVPYESTEETRYALRVIRGSRQVSEWMTGGIADLALTIMLSPASPRATGDAALALAENLSECNANALVKVLPFSAATGWALVEIRQIMAKAFQVDFIISSHDPGMPRLLRDWRDAGGACGLQAESRYRS